VKNNNEGQRLKFPPWRRLRSGRDFERIYALRQRFSTPHLLVFYAKNDGDHTRIGLSVSKRNGNSPVRHHIRRLIKEAYRLEQHTVPEGYDLICIPKQDGALSIQSLRTAFTKLAAHLMSKHPN